MPGMPLDRLSPHPPPATRCGPTERHGNIEGSPEIVGNEATRIGPKQMGFVLGCIFAQAIDDRELSQWALNVVMANEVEDLPEYIYDLLNFQGNAGAALEVVGMFNSTGPGEAVSDALTGIAYARGVEVYDPSITRSQAAVALRKRPDILDKFKKVFPFISMH
ncbi:hypothetical protein [Nocardia sp. GTS18]|uniref:hypothetical protein n=1 Tax=Nocardia sp. GTS18 TaxID=1778064 RepID=UPI0015EF1B1C|nr:hypothetical protein [Nocardia sp. GTS18]